MPRHLDDWITSYKKYNENTEPPELYHEWIACSVIAAVLQRKCKFQFSEDLVFYPNLYVVLVGPSGKCRKGTAMGVGMKFLREIGINMAAEATTREALIKELDRANTTEADPETGDVDMHASLTIYSPELTVFLGYDNKQLMSDLTDWYDCRDRWTYRTKNQGTDEIIGVYVNMIGATTPQLIRSTLPDDAIGGGLTSRMIFVNETEKEKVVPLPFKTEKEKQLREKLLVDLEDIQMLSGEWQYTDSFLQRYKAWYKHQEDNKPFDAPQFEGYMERRANHVLKLCIIHSASMGTDRTITVQVFERSLDLLTRTEENMPRTFSGHGEARRSGVLSKVMAFVIQNKKVTAGQVLEKFKYDIESRRDLDDIMKTFDQMGFADVSYGPEQTTIKYLDNYDGELP